jgi:hypothetical protein
MNPSWSALTFILSFKSLGLIINKIGISICVKFAIVIYCNHVAESNSSHKGLDVFDEDVADLIFGRERLAQDLLRHMKESRALFSTGPSGNCKSSLVRAGLLHAVLGGLFSFMCTQSFRTR